jgi:formate dehydrogenase
VTASERRKTYCRICEAACGLVAEIEGGEPVRLVPDREHPITRGYACIKGPAMLDVHRDPDRLARPERRDGDRWETLDWDRANREIGARLRDIRARHGNHAVAVYIGNPTAFSWGMSVYGTGFLGALGTRNFFNAASLDCQNKFLVGERMFGGYVVQPIPDLDHTQFFLCLGSNPLVSQMSFVVMPRPLERLRGILSRGGRVVLVNPRRTETAHALDGCEQIFIRPDTDVFLLLAMLRVLFDEGRVQRLPHLAGIDELGRALSGVDVREAAAATGVPADTIVKLARDFAAAPSANAYASTGVNMGSDGSAAFFAMQALNALTGNLDREGGARVPMKAITLARVARLLDRLRPHEASRIGGFPQVATSLPTGVLADEILTPGEGQVRALVVIAGNPMLSAPGAERLARALSSLELLVSVDLYRNETGALAHYTLPATDWLERADFPLLQVGMQPEPYLQETRAVAQPRDERRDEGRILTDLADAAGLNMFKVPGANAFLRRFGDRALRRVIFTLMGYPQSALGRQELVRLPTAPAGSFLQHVPTRDGRVQLADPELLGLLPRAIARLRREAAQPPALRLIGRRQRRSHNSWMHNLPRLKPAGDECRLSIHPFDAASRGIADGAVVEVRAARGSLVVHALLDEDVMPGTISLPHGWGHSRTAGWRVAAQEGQAGVNVNRLAADGPEAIEPLSGMARFNGIEVEVVRV